MKITFALSTLYNYKGIEESIQSIKDQGIPDTDYEILIIGPKHKDPESNINYIYFDESQRKGWITRKKNILAQEARFDNIIICNDYFVFQKDFYKNWVEFGEDWDVASNAQQYYNGQRCYLDGVTLDHPDYPCWTQVPYTNWSITKYMYQNGCYMVVKKDTMRRFPFNEKLLHGQEEDNEWSKRMRNHCKWVCNGKSIAKHNKVHHSFYHQVHHYRSVKEEF